MATYSEGAPAAIEPALEPTAATWPGSALGLVGLAPIPGSPVALVGSSSGSLAPGAPSTGPTEAPSGPVGNLGVCDSHLDHLEQFAWYLRER